MGVFPFEESKVHYKTKDEINVLKNAKGNELDIYQSVNNSMPHLPYFHGSYHFYGNDYYQKAIMKIEESKGG